MSSETFEARKQHLLMIKSEGIMNNAVHAITIKHPNTFAPNIYIILSRLSYELNCVRSEKKIPVLESKHTINIRLKNAGTPCV